MKWSPVHFLLLALLVIFTAIFLMARAPALVPFAREVLINVKTGAHGKVP